MINSKIAAIALALTVALPPLAMAAANQAAPMTGTNQTSQMATRANSQMATGNNAQMVAHAKQMAAHSKQMAAHSKQMEAYANQMAANSQQMAPNSKRLTAKAPNTKPAKTMTGTKAKPMANAYVVTPAAPATANQRHESMTGAKRASTMKPLIATRPGQQTGHFKPGHIKPNHFG